MLDLDVRAAIQAHWNLGACGEVPGDKQAVVYFDAVVRNSRQRRPWAHNYFGGYRTGWYVTYQGLKTCTGYPFR